MSAADPHVTTPRAAAGAPRLAPPSRHRDPRTMHSSLSRAGRTARPAVLALLAAAALACSGDSQAEQAAAQPQATVLAAEDVSVAEVMDLTTGILLTGSLEPAERAAVTAQVGGTLAGLTVDRGSRVSRGQRLATIQAEGVRSQAAGARANVAAAQASLAVARTQRDAARRLHAAGATSRVELQNAEAAFEAAEAQVAAARAQAVAASEAAGYTTVTAPIAGIVSERPAEPGEAVSPGDPILTIVNTSVLELRGTVPVDEAGAVRVGQPVSFALDAFPGREFHGTIARKDPTADPASRQVGVYVRLANSSGEITAGQFARGRVSGRTIEDAVTVPATAVQGSGDAAAVYVIEDGRLARRAVTVAARDEQRGVAAIASGLRAGERVLTRPTPTVAAGQPVVVADERAAPAAAPAPETAAADSTAADSTGDN
jgi:RND family efflux transporter MFP subunit